MEVRSGKNRLLGPRVKLGIFGLEIKRKFSRIMNDDNSAIDQRVIYDRLYEPVSSFLPVFGKH
jgi:hypothetical protein